MSRGGATGRGGGGLPVSTVCNGGWYAGAILLEPGSADSFLCRGFFHEILQRTAYVEGYVMEPLAERMLARDAKLRAEYEQAVAADAELAKSPQARLAWPYRRTPWADDRYLLYPVFTESGP